MRTAVATLAVSTTKANIPRMGKTKRSWNWLLKSAT